MSELPLKKYLEYVLAIAAILTLFVAWNTDHNIEKGIDLIQEAVVHNSQLEMKTAQLRNSTDEFEETIKPLKKAKNQKFGSIKKLHKNVLEVKEESDKIISEGDEIAKKLDNELNEYNQQKHDSDLLASIYPSTSVDTLSTENKISSENKPGFFKRILIIVKHFFSNLFKKKNESKINAPAITRYKDAKEDYLNASADILNRIERLEKNKLPRDLGQDADSSKSQAEVVDQAISENDSSSKGKKDEQEHESPSVAADQGPNKERWPSIDYLKHLLTETRWAGNVEATKGKEKNIYFKFYLGPNGDSICETNYFRKVDVVFTSKSTKEDTLKARKETSFIFGIENYGEVRECLKIVQYDNLNQVYARFKVTPHLSLAQTKKTDSDYIKKAKIILTQLKGHDVPDQGLKSMYGRTKFE